ncbi:hypothetical protein BD309DRAFT_865220 [Dichomitus squalens]|nr:hypothetical protein BD309DRAFT_865220 [Dichomitus squalens]
MSSAQSKIQTDSWGSPAAASIQRRAQPASDHIRDDWDDDEVELGEVEDPQKVWEEANKRARMPELVIAGSSTSGPSVTSPPPAAFQPVLRILKRPTATPSPSTSPSSVSASSSPSSNAPSGTYAEREARYRAARDRIFGDSSPSSDTPGESGLQTPQALKKSPPPVEITREPKGPPIAQAGADGRGQGGDIRGFGSRRGKRKGAGQP